MRAKAIKIIIIILLLSSAFQNTISRNRNPVGVAGFIIDENGNVVKNIEVIVRNINTTEEKSVYTNNDGIYAVSLLATDGDIIQAVVNYNNSTYANQTVVNTSYITQWLNVTFRKGFIPPHCNFYYIPTEPVVYENVRFYESAWDEDGEIVLYEWHFSDGYIFYGKIIEHSFQFAGEYIVTLIVKDNDGLFASCKKEIIVKDMEENYTEEDIFVPPLPPPLYPYKPYTIPEMYHMLNIDKLKGEGFVKVAVIDTGVTHRYYEGFDMSKIEAICHPSYTNPFDEMGHGTWCNFAVFYGLANFTSNFEQYSIKVIDKTSCPSEYLIDALELCKKMKVDVVSISLGGYGRLGNEIDMKVRELRRNGIIVVVAGGNFGPAEMTITNPAISPASIGVGAINPQFTIDILYDDTICEWSSRGPVEGLKEYKPDVVAGGESIIGPFLDEERVLSGTSMATPIVAGGCAVLYSKHSKLFNFLKKEYFFYKGIVPFIFERAIEKTAFTGGNIVAGNTYGNGIPQFDLAEKYAYRLAILFAILPFIIIAIIIMVYYFIRRKVKK